MSDEINIGDSFMSIEGFEPPEETVGTPNANATFDRRFTPPENLNFSNLIFSYSETPDVEEGECLFVITRLEPFQSTGVMYDGALEEDDALLYYFDKVMECNYVFEGSRGEGESFLIQYGATLEPRLG